MCNTGHLWAPPLLPRFEEYRHTHPTGAMRRDERTDEMTSPLPEGTRLLHSGPAATGTTRPQSAVHANRSTPAVHGVHDAGRDVQPHAGGALGGRTARHRSGSEA